MTAHVRKPRPNANAHRRLTDAGYVHLDGWVPADNLATKRAQQHLDSHRADVEALKAEPPKPRGRPRKSSVQAPID